MASLGVIAMWMMLAGVIGIVLGVFPTNFKQMGLFVAGFVLLGIGYGLQVLSSALPAPGPGPLPPPLPPPVGTFAEQVRSSFNGTKAEGQIIGALHTQFGDSLEYDGRQAKPSVSNTMQLGQQFAKLQQYRAGGDQPWSTKFAAMERVLSAEAKNRGIIGGNSPQLDATKRAAAAQYFKEIGNILSNSLYEGLVRDVAAEYQIEDVEEQREVIEAVIQRDRPYATQWEN